MLGGSWDVNDANVCLVLELCARGTLTDVLEKPEEPLTWLDHKLPIATGAVIVRRRRHRAAGTDATSVRNVDLCVE